MISIGETKINGDWRKAEEEVPDDGRTVLAALRYPDGTLGFALVNYMPEFDVWDNDEDLPVVYWTEIPDMPEEE